tara:strand:+ start:2556 stop:2819 length:264 start_codon:yes stop_codon:yes gene_type:complete
MERTAIPRFTMDEVWINEKYVVNIRPAAGYQKLLSEGHLPPELDDAHEFSMVTLNNGSTTTSHVVIGSVTFVAERLEGSRKRKLLKG